MRLHHQLLVLLCCVLAGCSRPHHAYWFEKHHPSLNNNRDDLWFYCDEKCLALENLSKDKDFVVVKFQERWKQPFSACYVKSGDHYLMWNKVVTSLFFEKYCGGDYKDWYGEGFPVTGVYGVGTGASLSSTLRRRT